MRVLIIESDEAFASSLSNALQASGAEVQTAAEGDAGFAVARAEKPDAIVLAVELGDRPTSGFAVCNKIRRDDDLRERKLILMSALASDETLDQHSRLRTRADTYLRKPFEPQELVAALGLQAAATPSSTLAPSWEDDLDSGATIDDLDLTGLVGEGSFFDTGLLQDDGDWEEVELDVGGAESQDDERPEAAAPGEVEASAEVSVIPTPEEATEAAEGSAQAEEREAELAALREAQAASEAEQRRLEEALADAESARESLQAKNEILEQRVEELEAQLRDAGADIRQELEALQGQKAQLEADVTRSQERLLRAYRKLKHDSQVHQRLQQSLADALGLLDSLESKAGESAS